MSLKRLVTLLPGLVTLAAIAGLLLHGRVLQFPDYNQFADRLTLWGIPNARNVLSNAGFALVGLYGLWRLVPRRREPALRRGFWGYAVFLAGVTLTAFGSAYYHLAPQNARLVFDRLPIALACAGLLAAVRAEARPRADARRDAAVLGLVGIGTVLWWRLSDVPPGAGDLGPYVLLQGLPLVLIPLWQWTTPTPREDRLWFAAALAWYVAAKAAELSDRQLFALTGVLSGHTLKHVLAALAAATIIVRLERRRT